MKKALITLFLISMLLFSVSVCTMASSIYIGKLVGSGWKSESDGSPSHDGDLTGLETAMDYSLGEFLSFNFEYIDGVKKDSVYGDKNFDTYRIGSGLNILSSVDSHIALTIGYNLTNFDDVCSSKVKAIMIGIDSLDCFAENGRIEASCSWSVSGTRTSNDSSDLNVSVFLSSLKYSYFITDNLGITVGYKYEQYYYDYGKDKTMFSGPIAGIICRF